MPNLNQTGPEGQGPMTGRRMGRCSGNNPVQQPRNVDAPIDDKNSDASANNTDAPVNENNNQMLGMGMARRRGFGGGGGGRGRGRGRGRW